ncbi:MAG: anti-sigma factor [Acidobacteria bacterium]|jgi:hypothetical protein|nr:anti-sigma factor [Acidobacteriota bacterium]
MNDAQKNRLFELLTDEALGGLSNEESVELNRLKKQFPEWENDFSLEMTATAIGLTNLSATGEALPPHLRAKILENADKYFSRAGETSTRASFPLNGTETAASPVNKTIAETFVAAESKKPFRQWFGWALAAAAACLVLGITLWLTRVRPSVEEAQTPKTVETPERAGVPETVKTPETVSTPETAAIPEPSKTPAIGGNSNTSGNVETATNPKSERNQESVRSPETFRTPNVVGTPEIAGVPKVTVTPQVVRTPQTANPPATELPVVQTREQLLASAPDVVQKSWTFEEKDKKVFGDVVWSNALQKGFVRLRDMPALDPNRETYQLWIVDEARGKKAPVNAGIFNVGQAGEVLVPINAQLRIIKPKSFAISKEKAGSAVSKPSRIVAIVKI